MLTQTVIQNISFFIPEAVLAGSFCLIILAGLVFSKRPAIAAILAFAGVAASLYFTVREVGTAEKIFYGMVAVDPFAVFFKCFIATGALFIIVFSVLSGEVRAAVTRTYEYYSLLVAMTLGMFLMSGTVNMLMSVLSMELTSLSAYILAGYMKDAPDSSEASLKYVIYGAVSSGIMLYGISILFGLTGTMDYSGMNRSLALNNYNYSTLLIATVFIIVGLGFKISAVPFHFWTPDVYEGSPITITALLSVASKAAGFAMIIRFFKVVFIDPSASGLAAGMWMSVNGFEWNNLLAVLSVLTMTLGNIVAVWQDNLKRLLAYSSIAHAGYMLMGVVILSDKGIASVMIYFVVYLFMNLGAFFVVMLIADKTGSEDIAQYSGLAKRAPFVSVAMGIFMFSLTGLPPTAGFIGKFYLFASLIDARWIWLAVIGVINSVISLYYYFRVLRYIFLREPGSQSRPVKLHKKEIIVLLILLIPTLVFGLYFTPIADAINSSVRMLGLF
jgi:NADH-quinone oxidoreductase subunit N